MGDKAAGEQARQAGGDNRFARPQRFDQLLASPCLLGMGLEEEQQFERPDGLEMGTQERRDVRTRQR
jgi:hypothetical protein